MCSLRHSAFRNGSSKRLFIRQISCPGQMVFPMASAVRDSGAFQLLTQVRAERRVRASMPAPVPRPFCAEPGTRFFAQGSCRRLPSEWKSLWNGVPGWREKGEPGRRGAPGSLVEEERVTFHYYYKHRVNRLQGNSGGGVGKPYPDRSGESRFLLLALRSRMQGSGPPGSVESTVLKKGAQRGTPVIRL